MSKQQFIELYQKFLDGRCSDEERRLLENYYSEIELLNDEWDELLGDKQQIENSIRSRVMSETGMGGNNIKLVPLKYNWLKLAAIFMVIITGGTVFFSYYNNIENKNNILSHAEKYIIKPGGNMAFLTLANGRSIIIQNKAKGIIASVAGVKISKLNDSLIAYSSAKNPLNNSPDTNELTVPRGGIFQTVLSDGTKVWMNAATTLRYPVTFAGKERRVILSGEAYFEVAKNKQMPFKVCANGMSVQVLGTHFNVMAYPDENTAKTTLLEGSVKLQSGFTAAMLVPGQQGILAMDKPGFKVTTVNTADIVAWKDGYFIFDNVPLHDIMKNISRWYNVDVVFKDNIHSSNFGGTIARSEDIRLVLKGLEATGSVHFKIEGRRVMVMD